MMQTVGGTIRPFQFNLETLTKEYAQLQKEYGPAYVTGDDYCIPTRRINSPLIISSESVTKLTLPSHFPIGTILDIQNDTTHIIRIIHRKTSYLLYSHAVINAYWTGTDWLIIPVYGKVDNGPLLKHNIMTISQAFAFIYDPHYKWNLFNAYYVAYARIMETSFPQFTIPSSIFDTSYNTLETSNIEKFDIEENDKLRSINRLYVLHSGKIASIDSTYNEFFIANNANFYWKTIHLDTFDISSAQCVFVTELEAGALAITSYAGIDNDAGNKIAIITPDHVLHIPTLKGISSSVQFGSITAFCKKAFISIGGANPLYTTNMTGLVWEPVFQPAIQPESNYVYFHTHRNGILTAYDFNHQGTGIIYTKDGTIWERTNITNCGFQYKPFECDNGMLIVQSDNASKIIYTSRDGGIYWEVQSSETSYSFDFFIELPSYQRIIGHSLDGLYYSDDYGKTWIESNIINKESNADITNAILCGDKIFVLIDHTLYYSKDGIMYHTVETEPFSAIAAINQTTLVSSVLNSSYNPFRYSFDGGKTWKVSENCNSTHKKTLKNGVIIYDDNKNGGLFYSKSKSDIIRYSNIQDGIWNVDTILESNGDIIISGDSGVMYSEDEGVSWHITNIKDDRLECPIIKSPDGTTLFIGVMDLVSKNFISKDNGRSWISLDSSITKYTQYTHQEYIGYSEDDTPFVSNGSLTEWNVLPVDDNAYYSNFIASQAAQESSIDIAYPNNPKLFNPIRVENRCISGSTHTGIRLSDDFGITWYSSNITDGWYYTPIALINNMLISASITDGIVYSTDCGKTWTKSDFQNKGVYAVVELGGGHLIATLVNGGLIYSTDYGKIWKYSNITSSRCMKPVYFPAFNMLVSSSSSLGFIISKDLGMIWEPYGVLPRLIEKNSLYEWNSLVKTRSDTLIAASSIPDSGIIYSTNYGATWVQYEDVPKGSWIVSRVESTVFKTELIFARDKASRKIRILQDKVWVPLLIDGSNAEVTGVFNEPMISGDRVIISGTPMVIGQFPNLTWDVAFGYETGALSKPYCIDPNWLIMEGYDGELITSVDNGTLWVKQSMLPSFVPDADTQTTTTSTGRLFAPAKKGGYYYIGDDHVSWNIYTEFARNFIHAISKSLNSIGNGPDFVITSLYKTYDNKTLVASINNSMIAYSEDNGFTWRASDIFDKTTKSILILDISTMSHIIAKMQPNVILVSTTQGKHWIEALIINSTGKNIVHISTIHKDAIDAYVGIICLESDVEGLYILAFIKSNTSGETWIVKPFPIEEVSISYYSYRIFCVKHSRIILRYFGFNNVGDFGPVYYTYDEGNTWTQVYSLPSQSQIIQIIEHNQKLIATVKIKSDPTIMRSYFSNNGGKDWIFSGIIASIIALYKHPLYNTITMITYAPDDSENLMRDMYPADNPTQDDYNEYIIRAFYSYDAVEWNNAEIPRCGAPLVLFEEKEGSETFFIASFHDKVSIIIEDEFREETYLVTTNDGGIHWDRKGIIIDGLTQSIIYVNRQGSFIWCNSDGRIRFYDTDGTDIRMIGDPCGEVYDDIQCFEIANNSYIISSPSIPKPYVLTKNREIVPLVEPTDMVSEYHSILEIDTAVLIAITTNGGIYYSQNDGITWERTELGDGYSFTSALIVYEHTAIIAGKSGIACIDSKTLPSADIICDRDDILFLAKFPGVKNPIIAGSSNGGIIISYDYGKHWCTTNCIAEYYTSYSILSSRRIIAGGEGPLAYSDDCGITWHIYHGEYRNYNSPVEAVDRKTLVITSRVNNGILYSEDAGNTWQHSNITCGSFYRPSFNDLHQLIAISIDSITTAYLSTDCGRNWSIILKHS